MMRSDYNPVFPHQEQYAQSMPEYWGGYQQPLPYLQQEPMMYPYPPQQNGGFGLPYHDPYQQAAYTPNEQVQQQSINAGTLPGSSVMQPMQQPNQPLPGNPQMQPLSNHQMQPNQPMLSNPQMQPNQPLQGNQYMQKQANGFNPFDNPLQPAKRPPQMQQQVYNPYPNQQFMQKQQPSGIKSVMNQFKTQDGSMDITKMMNTAGQMMNTVSQVSSMVKGVGGFFKV